MRVPPNKRHLVVNKEYSRLPYWTDEGFEDVQRQTSQKYVQDSFGAFPESENQLPYLSDADYQGLEYQYQNPEFFDPTDLPDVDIINTVPKGTCYDLWVSMFGNSPNGFFPTSSQYQQLMEYAKKCPLIYVPHWCCDKAGMKINGPDTVAPGEKAEYTVSGGLFNCSYSWDADRGRIVGGTYEAPETSGSDKIWIYPFLSDDMNRECIKKDITIEGGCKGTVHATTPQMTVGASQTLYIEGGSEGSTYHWSTTSGSLSPLTGTSVTYTAPATNPNCVNNPTITVTCGGATIGTLTIAVNADTSGNWAVSTYTGYKCEHIPEDNPYITKVYLYKNQYGCDGSLNPYTGISVDCEFGAAANKPGGPPPDCSYVCSLVCGATCSEGGIIFQTRLDTPVVDLRFPNWIAGGCCPALLL